MCVSGHICQKRIRHKSMSKRPIMGSYRKTKRRYIHRHNSFNPFSAGTAFRRQNLTTVDVRFWRLKSILALKKYKMAVDPYHIGIQMKRKQLTKAFMRSSNWKTLWSPWFIQKSFSVVRVNCSKCSVKERLTIHTGPIRNPDSHLVNP